MVFRNCSMYCCGLQYVHSSFTIILMGKRELVALLSLSSWCVVIVVWLFLAVPWVCLHFVIVLFPDHTHYFRCILYKIEHYRKYIITSRNINDHLFSHALCFLTI